MEWFTGGIAEAIQAAKSARGIFVVVVVSGKSELLRTREMFKLNFKS
jgi:hypothetical protein